MKKKSLLNNLSKIHFFIVAICLAIILFLVYQIYVVNKDRYISRFYEFESVDKDFHGYLVQSFYVGSIAFDEVSFKDEVCSFKYKITINDKDIYENEIQNSNCDISSKQIMQELSVIKLSYYKKINELKLSYKYDDGKMVEKIMKMSRIQNDK